MNIYMNFELLVDQGQLLLIFHYVLRIDYIMNQPNKSV